MIDSYPWYNRITEGILTFNILQLWKLNLKAGT